MLKLKNRILTDGEFRRVLCDLRLRSKRSIESRQNSVIFRLAVCCGLSRSEIAEVQLRDVRVDSNRPELDVVKARPRSGKISRKPRIVPLSLDRENLQDLIEWKRIREKQSDGDRMAPFVCGQRRGGLGKPLPARSIAKKWRTAIRALGPERVSALSIFSGRHTFCFRLLAAGVGIRTVQLLAGHACVELTASYQELIAPPKFEPDGRLFSTS